MTADTAPDGESLALTLVGLATGLARDAGRLALELATEARRSPGTKSSDTDLVTEADRRAERLIVDGILAARPHDAIEGEEGTSRLGTSGVTWHVDPIDGTTNYVYGIPAFSVSVAAEIDRRMVAGVVFDPSRNRLYRAAIGDGAWCDDRPLRLGSGPELDRALVATGFGYRAERRRHQGRVVAEVLPQVRDIRRFGSAALDLCAVASGEVDAYYERGLHRWDLAAGALVAAEAGAVVQNLDGGDADEGFALAAPPGLFASLRELLIELGAGEGA
ncbi:MAG: inositol monophosphatase family protein [Acidimicrobiales bacterium]